MVIADGVNEPEMTQAFSAVSCLPEAQSQSQVTGLFPVKCQDYVTSSGRLFKMVVVPTQRSLLLSRAAQTQPRLGVLLRL